jgi:tetratricopeptide (TPR) repeat protein
VKALADRLAELVPMLGGHTLAQVHAQLEAEQDRYFALLDTRPARALAVARATLRTLDRVCPRHPHDSDLQLDRGYTHKNIARALQRLGRDDGAEAALADAERTFRTAVSERPDDAGAWNGLGSVAAVRGHLRPALRLVEKALSLAPGYPAALHDRAVLLAALGQR